MSTTVEFAGQDLAEAIAAAAGALNLPPEQLKFKVVEMGTKGFLGLGRRRARIAVDPADPALFLDEALPEASPPPPPSTPAMEEPQAAETEAPPQAPLPQNTPPPLPAAPPPGPAQPAKGPRGAHRPLLDLPALTRPAAGETKEDDPKDETALLTRAVLMDILSRLGLAADLTLTRLGSRLLVSLDGPDRALLIGARGATLEALELLVTKVITKKKPGEGLRLVLDVADYRTRRHNQVLENLKFMVETARRTGQAQTLTGLSSAERRLVRLAFRPIKDLHLKAGRSREALLLTPAAPEPGRRPRRKPKGEPK